MIFILLRLLVLFYEVTEGVALDVDAAEVTVDPVTLLAPAAAAPLETEGVGVVERVGGGPQVHDPLQERASLCIIILIFGVSG